jgi:hypothetical protein
MEATTEPDAKQWLFSMISYLKHEELTRCLVTLWEVWFARRKAIHEDIYQSPLTTHAFVESFLRDLALTEERNKKSLHPRGPEPEKKWLAPPQGFAKINVDAAVKKTGGAGVVAARQMVNFWAPDTSQTYL